MRSGGSVGIRFRRALRNEHANLFEPAQGRVVTYAASAGQPGGSCLHSFCLPPCRTASPGCMRRWAVVLASLGQACAAPVPIPPSLPLCTRLRAACATRDPRGRATLTPTRCTCGRACGRCLRLCSQVREPPRPPIQHRRMGAATHPPLPSDAGGGQPRAASLLTVRPSTRTPLPLLHPQHSHLAARCLPTLPRVAAVPPTSPPHHHPLLPNSCRGGRLGGALCGPAS